MHFENNDHFKSILKHYNGYKGLLFSEEGLIINALSKRPVMDIAKIIDALQCPVNVGYSENNIIAFYTKQLANENLQELGLEFVSIKSFLGEMHDDSHMQVVRAAHWLNWDMLSKFCGRCGTLLNSEFTSVEKKCTQCGLSLFPKVSPAVMVLISRDKEILLARSHHFRPGMFSAIAGFIELGETAEMAAHREVKEELGIEISNLTYFGTQTWPFPDSFMIAFHAQYAGGDLILDKNEIEAAYWFNKDTLPTLPISASISRRLIESIVRTW